LDIRKLQRAIVDGLEDVKAQNIAVFNTEELSPLFERVIIASGTSNRQTKALAASVRDAVKATGQPLPRTEGEDNGEWIIVDCGAAVAHIMQPAIRQYYHLEEIWGTKPVRMKLDTAVKLPKAGDASPRESAAPRKIAAKKVAAKKSAAGKSPAKKMAARKPSVTRVVGVKSNSRSPASGTSAPKKTVARKTTARKTATRP
jgi:ribosome-associated protein